MKFNIRLKLIIFTFCIVILVGGGISLYAIVQGRQRIIKTFEKEARDITAVIAETIANDLYFVDLLALRRQLQGAHVNLDIRKSYVMGATGVVLADGTGANPLRGQMPRDAFGQRMLRSAGWISSVEEDSLKVGGPVLMPDGSRVGYLQVEFSLDSPYEIIRETTRSSFTITLISLVIGLSLAVFAAGRFSRPIVSIVKAAEEIGAGKWDIRLPAGRGDELGMLAGAINRMATSRKQAEEKIERSLDRIRALHEIDHAITSTLEIKTVLGVLLDKIDLLLPYSVATVRLINKESGILEAVACKNLDEQEWRVDQWKAGRGPANVVFETRTPMMIRNIEGDPRIRDPEFFRKHGLISYLGVPLIVQDKVLGVLSFYTKEERAFSNDEVEFLTTLAGQAAVAIHNSQLYEEMTGMAAQLSRSNKVKDEFLSIMSHELRTPLNVVLGYTGMIRDRLLGEINLEQEKALDKVLSRARDQLTMIGSILQATQMEAEGVQVISREFSLDQFLNDLRSSYEIPMGKKVALTWDYPSDLPVVKTDGEKLKYVLQNLINNAIKFTPEGSVRVSARILPLAASPLPRIGVEGNGSVGAVEFKVRDTGIGIPEEFFPVIFERFRQVDSTETRQFGGVGIGLYIVKQFTEMLGGKVEVESEVGKGSTFTVTIPYES